MIEFIFMALIFTCGSFLGLVLGAFMAASREADEFDGGYRHNHKPDEPRVRTIIYSNDITEDKP